MHADLQAALEFHDAVIAEGSKALVGYDVEKALANVVLLSEIPTSYDKDQKRQVNSGNLLLKGVPVRRDGADRKSVRVGKECRSRWSPYH